MEQLTAQTQVLETANQQLAEELAVLRQELELRRQAGDTSAIVSRNARIQELEDRNHELRNQFSEARQKAAEEIKLLTDQRDSNHQLAERLAKQVAELEECCAGGGRSLPDPATLLNQLRQQLPKGKASLKEVEVLLRLIGGTGE